MKRSDTRILTTHVGSLIRPPELVELAKAGRESRRYCDALTRAVADVVSRQVDAGVDIVNDGEYGKSSWANYVLQRMTGFESRPAAGKSSMAWLGTTRK